jgi:hypothetical protein
LFIILILKENIRVTIDFCLKYLLKKFTNNKFQAKQNTFFMHFLLFLVEII